MPLSPTKPFAGIFVCYRRDDSSGHAGRLSDKLVDHFGKDRIFMDIDTIEPGDDFVAVIEDAVGSCEILIAVIGRNWLSGTHENPRELDNQNDFVRLEIATALRRDIRVIPILVQRASMPKPQDLPEDLVNLARRNAIELSDLDWQNDVQQLITVIDRILGENQTNPKPDANPAPHSPARTLISDKPEPDLSGLTQPRNGSKRTVAMVVAIGLAMLVVVIISIGILIWMMKRSAEDPPTAKPKAALQPEQATSVSPVRELRPPPGMVYVPGGEFMMGRNSDDPRETPAHKVTVNPFFIDVYEVTCAEYKKYLDLNPDQPAPSNWVERRIPDASASLPVTGVDWYQAKGFGAWSKKRLPTEAEWEFAARGTDGRLYPWGHEWRAGLANTGTAERGPGDGQVHMKEIGFFKGKSPYGVYDMVGNAWEWTASDFEAYPGGVLSRAIYSSSDLKVIRGGSWATKDRQATVALRRGYRATGEKEGYSYTGFRLARDIGTTNR